MVLVVQLVNVVALIAFGQSAISWLLPLSVHFVPDLTPQNFSVVVAETQTEFYFTGRVVAFQIRR